MTGLIGGRWTAGNRLEPSRPNGRGRKSCTYVSSVVVDRPRGGPRQREGHPPTGMGLPPARRQPAGRRSVAESGRVGARTGGRARLLAVVAHPGGSPARRCGGWGVPVAESVLAPPGPIPNPVVTQRSAGEYWGGDPLGGEAAAGTPHPLSPAGRRPGRNDRWLQAKSASLLANSQQPVAGWSSGSSLGS